MYIFEGESFPSILKRKAEEANFGIVLFSWRICLDRAFYISLLIKPHEQVRRLVIVLCIGPIRVTLGTVIAVVALASSFCIRSFHQNPYGHAVIVSIRTSLPVKRCAGVWATLLLQWHYAILVLVQQTCMHYPADTWEQDVNHVLIYWTNITVINPQAIGYLYHE